MCKIVAAFLYNSSLTFVRGGNDRYFKKNKGYVSKRTYFRTQILIDIHI